MKKMNNYLKLNTYLFYFLYIVSFLISIIESVKYRGFIQKHFFIDLNLLIALTFVTGVVSLFHIQKETKFNKKIKSYYYRIQLVIFPALFVFWAISESLNSINYPNYIFSKLHIIPDNILTTLFISFFLIIIERIRTVKTKSNTKKGEIIENIQLGVLAIFVLTVLQNSVKTPMYVLSQLTTIIKHPQASYEDKMGSKWSPDIFRYIELVKVHTAEDSKILIPPRIDPPWGIEGNDHLMRGFFYPRFVVSYKKGLNPEKFDYVLMSPGLWRDFTVDSKLYLFPDFPLKAKRIYIFDLKKNKVKKIYEQNYDPKNKIYQNEFGLIEI